MKKKVLMGVLIILFMINLAFVSSSLYALDKDEIKEKGYLGVTLFSLTRLDRQQLDVDFGVLVNSVEKDSPADQAGILDDDVIQYYNGQEVKRVSTLTEMIRDTKVGSFIQIKLNRRGKNKTLKVTIGKREDKSIGFFYNDLIRVSPEHKKIKIKIKPYLGVQLHRMNESLKGYFHESGALVLQVEEDSPADQGGMKAGDVITAFDKHEVENIKELHKVLSKYEPDVGVTVQVIRHKKVKNFKIKLGSQKGFFCWHIPPHFNERIGIIRDRMKGLGERIKDRVIRIKDKVRDYIII